MDLTQSPQGRIPLLRQPSTPQTSETGTLRTLAGQGTEWLGSSSGIYFVNTVRRAFNAAISSTVPSPSAQPHNGHGPAAEDILAGEDVPTDSQLFESNLGLGGPVGDKSHLLLTDALGRPPPKSVADELGVLFFRTWHPLFPFLHGPTFLHDIDLIYSGGSALPYSPYDSKPFTSADIARYVTFQLVINVASLHWQFATLPAESKIRSPKNVANAIGILGFNHDVRTIQALLAAELYLVATLALRPASIVAGITLRTLFHAGIHRCPVRYPQLTENDCDLRKRIFWSAYALDRHLSQSLGDPITLQDSDVDVCMCSCEVHHFKGPVRTPNLVDTVDVNMSLAEKRRREAPLTAYVEYSRLIGRIVETFHKSLLVRSMTQEAILNLTTDIESWWNDLPSFLSDDEHADSVGDESNLRSFFSVLYQHLILLLHRPRLSLATDSAEFQHGLQVCIRASRSMLAIFKPDQAPAELMQKPGVLSATWTSGLIIAFAFQMNKYSSNRATTDIRKCLECLQVMEHLTTGRSCHMVLSSLLRDIEQHNIASYSSGDKRPQDGAEALQSLVLSADEPALKKSRTTEGGDVTRHHMGISDIEPESLAFPGANAAFPDLEQDLWGNLDFDVNDIFGFATFENLVGTVPTPFTNSMLGLG